MPKIISYTPPWLSRNTPGFRLFNTRFASEPPDLGKGVNGQENGNAHDDSYVGPNKTIARRGTEVFLVAGKYIRWSDLSVLKDNYEEQQQTPSRKPRSSIETVKAKAEDEGPEDGSYRVLKPAVGEQIRQLSISPNGSLLAIATSHTVHIAILPDSSHLGQIPNKLIKLKTYTIGPTAHVLSQSQVTNILWHPFGVEGNCLVTVTTDAAVSLWEFDQDNRWSCDKPSLAIDLKKLVMGSSEEENFGPDKFGRNRRFSLDNVGLEVASACFGGTGSSHESGWCPMTLWIAMKGGDVYALCPLLPSKWQPSRTIISPLSSAAVAKNSSNQKEDSSDSEENRQCHDQLEWIRDVDGQEPTLLDDEDEDSLEIYSRPSRPGPIPRLQGPFQILSEDTDDDLELSDIHVIAAKLDEEEFIGDDDSDLEFDSEDDNGLSVSTIALLTRTGRTYVCHDLDGVEGQWLPRKNPKRQLTPPEDPYLVVFEALDTLSPNDLLDPQWPTFSLDVSSDHSFFITHSKGIFSFSLDPWVSTLEKELKNSEKLGAPLRIDNIKKGPGTLRERILSFDQDQDSAIATSVAACLNFQDSDLGYFLLTSVGNEPRAVTFDEPYEVYQKPTQAFEDDDEETYMPQMDLLSIGPAREAYHESESFYIESSLPRFIEKHVSERHKRTFKENVRLSTVTLDMMTQAHRVLSQETHRLGLAASDLFRRCERLQDELRDQIKRAKELASRTDDITDEDPDPYLDSIRGKKAPNLDERLHKVRDRQEELTSRYEAVRKKFASVSGRALSEKEQHWASEVDKVQRSIETEPEGEESEEEAGPELRHRYREAENLKEDLVARARELSKDSNHSNGVAKHTMPSDIRERKVEEVRKLLEVETELLEGAQARLQRLDSTAI